MKLNKILAGLSATAMAVSMLTLLTTSADAEPVTLTGSHTFAESTTNAGQVEPIVLQILQSNYNFAPDDTISITVECTSGDSSDWQVAVNAYDTSWGGQGNIASEPGTLTLTTTVADVVGTTGNESISEDLSNLQGLNFNIWEADIGESLTYELKINGGTVSSTDSSEAEDSSSEVVEDSSSEVVEDSSSEVVEDSSSEVVEDSSSEATEDSSEADEPTVTVPTEDFEVSAEFIAEADGNLVVYLLGDPAVDQAGAFDSAAQLSCYVGFTLTISIDEATAASAATGETWIGGAFGTNSESTGWSSNEISFQDGAKPYTWTKVSDGVYQVTYMVEDGTLFADTDTYAQLFYQDWSAAGIQITGATLIAPEAEAPVDPDDSSDVSDDSSEVVDDSSDVVDDSSSDVSDDSSEADEPTATVPTEDYEIPSEFIGVNANGEQVVFLLPDEENGMPGAFTSASEFAGYVGFTMTITVDDVAAADIANGAWVGGAFGTNCTSTGWTAYEIAFQDGQKPYTWTQVSDNVYEVTFMVEEGTLFTTAEEYAQLFYIDYSEHGSNIAITGLTLLAPTSADVPGDDSTPAGDDSTPAGDESTATGDDSTVTGGDDSTQTPSGSDESPVTGSAALATVGVLLAAAAVIVTKKK